MIGCDRKVALVAGGDTDKRVLAQFDILVVVEGRVAVGGGGAGGREVD